jgi:hypothetical protein
MKVTNNWGRIVTCCVCQSEDIEKYYIHTPPFADAMNSVYIGGCKDHVKEAEAKHNQATSSRMNTLMMSSDS